MTESVQMAIVGLIGTAFGILVTKGIDAIIRFRRSEGQMAGENENKLLTRIVHLESEVARLQNEISELQYDRGKSDSIINLLLGRVDRDKMLQLDQETFRKRTSQNVGNTNHERMNDDGSISVESSSTLGLGPDCAGST